MSLGSMVKSSVRSSLDIFHSLTRHPRLSRHLLENIGWASRGVKYSRKLWPGTQNASAPRSESGY